MHKSMGAHTLHEPSPHPLCNNMYCQVELSTTTIKLQQRCSPIICGENRTKRKKRESEKGGGLQKLSRASITTALLTVATTIVTLELTTPQADNTSNGKLTMQ